MLAVLKIMRNRLLATVTAALLVALLASAAGAQTTHPAKDSSQGVVFHFGVVPAEIVQAHPSDHPERVMHGGGAKGQKHLVLALFDASTGDRIAQADVQATVTLLGGSGVSRRLQPMMVADQPSFGGFFSMTPRGVYRIRFEVKRPDRPNAVAEFEYRVPG